MTDRRSANADLQDPSALICAAQARRWQSITALCLADCFPSFAYLARAIGVTCAYSGQISADTLRIVEILLAAGAEDIEVAETLIAATKQGQHQLLKLTINYSEPDRLHLLTAIESSMKVGDLVSFQSLATASLESASLDDLLSYFSIIRSAVSSDARYEILKTIVECRPSPGAISQALLESTEHSELEMAQFLVGAGASLSYMSGRTLEFAVQKQSVELVSILLRGNLS
jgi:hypothetical protein